MRWQVVRRLAAIEDTHPVPDCQQLLHHLPTNELGAAED
jgi:hypothetical protein